jgi:hypothetical protein
MNAKEIETLIHVRTQYRIMFGALCEAIDALPAAPELMLSYKEDMMIQRASVIQTIVALTDAIAARISESRREESR